MNWLKWVMVVTTIMGQLPQTILAIEQAFGAKNGTAKKDVVIGTAVAAAVAAGANVEQTVTLANSASTIIDSTVAALNATGVLKSTVAP
jgi:hypothetical protein